MIIEIKLIGTNNTDGIKLRNNLKTAMQSLKNNTKIQEINDTASILEYNNIKYTPALIINGVIITQGKAMPSIDLEKFLSLI